MSAKPVFLRERARQDIEEAVDRYIGVAGEHIALGFIDALEQAVRHIGQHPGTGSPRYAQELDLPKLRSWPMTRYPYLVFHVEHADHIDAWRVLHGRRDIPERLREPDQD